MSETTSVLLIEDDADDAYLIGKALSRTPGGNFALEVVDRLSRGIDRVAEGGIDVILLDLTLPDSMGLDTLQKTRAAVVSIPIVVMTGLDEESVALAALQQGAQDYLIKGQAADNLARSLRYAIARKELERLKEDFLHNVNHELNVPLSCVYTAVRSLEEGVFGELTPDQRRATGLAARSLAQLMRMVEDLDALLRTGTGKLTVVPEKVGLPAVIDEVLRLLSESRPAQGLALSAEVPDDLPAAHADPVRLRQILINLVGNAVKFTPKGGTVTVSAGLWEGGAEFLRVSVKDTGCGIPGDKAEKLFDRLYQVQGTDDGVKRGLGIGLFLCRDLVKRHGGEIWVTSAVGEGSTFSFTLPVWKGK
ncbi:MAG: response regulator [Elusimicrobia bacterium]|nr:response regulator [Elusimicrobiota bacterium]